MGIDTGACKKYRITNKQEVIFEDYYDDIEGEYLKYPNGEFVELADAIREVSQGDINLRNHLIWEEIDYRKPDYSRIIKQLENFSFDNAIAEGNQARIFLEKHYEEVKKVYAYVYDPIEVIDYLVGLWNKGYYVDYS